MAPSTDLRALTSSLTQQVRFMPMVAIPTVSRVGQSRRVRITLTFVMMLISVKESVY